MSVQPLLFEPHAAAPDERGFILRPYQQEAVDNAVRLLSEGKNCLVVMPTGTGKTVVFAEVINRMLGERQRALVVAHRDELIRQARDKIAEHTSLKVGIEKADFYAGGEPVIVSSVQTQDKRKQRFSRTAYRLVICDEAHHTPARTWGEMIAHYSHAGCPVLGVTATPNRADEKALGQIFSAVAYEYWLADAVRDGWLVPLKQQTLVLEGVDLDGLKRRGKGANRDLSDKDLDLVLSEQKPLLCVARGILDHAGAKRTLVFSPGVRHARALAQMLNNAKPGSARVVWGELPEDERRTIIDEFKAGRYQYLVNVAIATEGFDDPGIECIAIARPTESQPLFCQIIGRGTRPLPRLVDGYDSPELRRAAIAASAKPHILILDFTANSRKHKLVSVVDVLGGKMDERVVARAKRMTDAAAKRGEVIDPLRALTLAEQAIVREQNRKAAKAAQQAHDERQKWLKLETGEVRWKVQTLNPFDRFNLVPEREREWNKGRVVDAVTAGYLRARGVDPSGLTFTQAEQLANHMRRNNLRNGPVLPPPAPTPASPAGGWQAAPATNKQKWFLRHNGHTLAEVNKLTKAEASRMIGALKRKETSHA